MEGLAQRQTDVAQKIEGLQPDSDNPAQTELLELRAAVNTMRREMQELLSSREHTPLNAPTTAQAGYMPERHNSIAALETSPLRLKDIADAIP